MGHLGYLRGDPAGRRGGRPLLERLRQQLRPAQLADLALRGARPAAPVRLVIGRDVSGSMEGYQEAREAAFGELVAWAPANLRPTDELAVLDFAEGARWALRPTTVQHLATVGAKVRATGLDGSWTRWEPVVDRVRSLGAHAGSTSVWLLSDGEYPDYPASADAGRRLLVDAGVASMPLLIPSTSGRAPDPWEEVFPDQPVLAFDGHGARATALAFAAALTLVTGQRLVRLGRPGRERTSA